MDKIKMKTEKDQKQQQANQDEKAFGERLDLLRKAKEVTGRQLTVSGTDGSLQEIDELKTLINKKMEDPEEKYELYYNGVQTLLKRHLPKGKSFKQGRDYIYDEKNIFLTRGKAKDVVTGKRGADSRMTYNKMLKELVEVIAVWIMEGANPANLYQSLYELNDKYNFGHQSYNKTDAKKKTRA
jgi:hypothetical protein